MSTKKQQTGQIDYLDKCPNELWLEIFTIALGPFSRDTPYQPQTFTLNISPGSAVLHDAQKNRSQLLTLSKKLFVILEQLLFRDVILKGPTQYKKFMTRAKTQSSDRKNRGYWTKALKVYSGYRRSVPTSLLEITLACPTLRLLEIGPMAEIDLGKTMEMDEWSSNIRYLHWSNCDLTWDHLHKLSTQLPQLTQLGLFGCDEDNQCDSTITFPRLRYFEISSDCAEQLDISKFRMPSLDSVTMEVGGSERIDAFLRQHGSRIKVLEFVPWDNLTDPLEFVDGLFNACSALEELSFIPAMFEPLEVSGEIPSASNSLRILRVGIDDIEESRIEEHAAYFSYDRFPNITRILIDPRWGSKPDQVQQCLKGCFPHATIEIPE